MIPDKLIQDLKELKKRDFEYVISEDGYKIYITIKNFPIPSGYNMKNTDLLIFTSTNYPNAGFDMFWTDKNLTLKNGNIPKQAETIELHLGIMRRRFSYHPYQNKPWNPSEDDVGNYVAYVEQRLKNCD